MDDIVEVESTEPEVVNPLSMSDEQFDAYEEAQEAPVEVSEEVLDESEAIVPEEAEDTSETEETEPESTEVEFSKESAYDELMGEFKANGKMMSVDTVAEARQLMQMGANYNKKMASMKEQTKFVKMLENNKLLDEGKLNYLIDLANKDAGAIKQLLKESEYEPDYGSEDDGSEYEPNNHTIDEATVQLDEVLVSLQETDTGTTTIDIIGNQWDKTSRDELAGNPKDIMDLNDNVASGIYDEIQVVMEKERMLGNLNGITDFQAYKMVGNAMHTKGMFKSQVNAAVPKVTEPEATTNTNDAKKAAATTRSSKAVKQAKVSKNPLSMSDEEFDKLFGSD